MPYLGNKPVNNFVSFAKQNITGNGGTSYSLDHAVTNANDIELFINNVRQEPTEAYSASGATLTLTGAISSTDDVYVIFRGRALGTSGVPDDAVGTSQLQNNSVGTSQLATTVPLGLLSIQSFTSSGSFTWTKPSNVRRVKVIVTGGGGSGGGGGGNQDFGAGGGAGGTAIKVIDVSSVSTVSVTVGAGGAAVAGNSGNTSGNAGAASSFGSYCSATSGGGGAHGNAGPVLGGAGGVGVGGDLNLAGGRGMNGWDNFTGTTYTWASGLAQGGASFWGGGGAGNYAGSQQQLPAPASNVPGAGGGGAFYEAVGNSGAGAPGIVYIEEYA
jgi:hypothetical protein